MADDQFTALYLITPPRLEDPQAFAEELKAALDAGGADCVQLRLKDVDDDTIRRITDILRPVTQERDVAFVMNDRPDLVRETGCDGVHVGQNDASYSDARALLGPKERPRIRVARIVLAHMDTVAASLPHEVRAVVHDECDIAFLGDWAQDISDSPNRIVVDVLQAKLHTVGTACIQGGFQFLCECLWVFETRRRDEIQCRKLIVGHGPKSAS